jgi:hypothetical protein
LAIFYLVWKLLVFCADSYFLFSLISITVIISSGRIFNSPMEKFYLTKTDYKVTIY